MRLYPWQQELLERRGGVPLRRFAEALVRAASHGEAIAALVLLRPPPPPTPELDAIELEWHRVDREVC